MNWFGRLFNLDNLTDIEWHYGSFHKYGGVSYEIEGCTVFFVNGRSIKLLRDNARKLDYFFEQVEKENVHKNMENGV